MHIAHNGWCDGEPVPMAIWYTLGGAFHVEVYYGTNGIGGYSICIDEWHTYLMPQRLA
jgi:hypothetical protein